MMLITRNNHNISRKNISKNALKILNRLSKLGYEAYLVGGCIRDLIIGCQPKDFDITTNATPQELKKLFRNSRVIGRRFKIIHIIFYNEIIEVSTFRGNHRNSSIHTKYKNFKKNKNGLLLTDNIFGKIEEDAQRRDLTINTLYYSMKDFCIRDYVGGINDIKQKIVRLIGNPELKYREDPVRMLRVIRFSVQLNMRIEKETARKIPKLANLLTHIPSARLFDESVKLLQTGHGYNTYKKLKQFSLIQSLISSNSLSINKKLQSITEKITIQTLKIIDFFYKKNRSVVYSSLLFSSILWYTQLYTTLKIKHEKKIRYIDAFLLAINITLNNKVFFINIPKKISAKIKKIWIFQLHMNNHLLYSQHLFKNNKNRTLIQAFELFKIRSHIENYNKLNYITIFWKYVSNKKSNLFTHSHNKIFL
ncbi:poly(A) polymerase I [Buchnera aphidicola (Nipponaphis monzeni)]|uniref:Poly(A) polymerase I n=1 Tax=Buchnera aphidicola (Nipponaphis monzeni) TaxID=2495405 RepID=A0A455TA41_9GAMM|nr:polynucleotide adenylyltransferase PcnB [Buchnera aphidicola]BBI01175.1 poly(A) polymerase I [Buchnera aphidicola (Nipponaphis monzeni)]